MKVMIDKEELEELLKIASENTVVCLINIKERDEKSRFDAFAGDLKRINEMRSRVEQL